MASTSIDEPPPPQEERRSTEHPSHLSPSELGTKEYWETFYERSLSNLSSKKKQTQTQTQEDEDHDPDPDPDSDSDSDNDEDPSDPGTSWFTEHNAPEKVLQFLTSSKLPLPVPPHTQPTILDLGTGNGSMLSLLSSKGGSRFSAEQMVGVDYSPKSVELARRLWDGSGIRFEVWDVFGSGGSGTGEMPGWFPSAGFDVVLDKGTFDAVSLSEETVVVEEDGGGGERKGDRVVQRRVCGRYPGIARGLVKKGGFLVVTSCNWTEEELVRWFTGRFGEDKEQERDRLVVWDRVEYPRFKFGGQEGQGVCTVCFKREG